MSSAVRNLPAQQAPAPKGAESAGKPDAARPAAAPPPNAKATGGRQPRVGQMVHFWRGSDYDDALQAVPAILFQPMLTDPDEWLLSVFTAHGALLSLPARWADKPAAGRWTWPEG